MTDPAKITEGVPRFSVVYVDLKKRILNGELTPNTPLTEEALAEEFQVSRTPIRDALRKLEQDGLVEIIRRKGTYVRGLSTTDIEEIFTIREALEGICARVATELISNQNLDYLEMMLNRADEEFARGNIETAHKTGNEIHDVILRIAGNHRILNTVSNLKDHIQRLHTLSTNIPGRLELSNKQHWEIFHAIQKKNAELAENKMREHIRSTRSSIIIAVKNDITMTFRRYGDYFPKVGK
jgi:DNA-binding GntR family transcriptional regulator